MLRSASRADGSLRTRRCRCQAARSRCLDPHDEPTSACTMRRQPQVQPRRAAGRRSRARRHSRPRAIQPRWVPSEKRSSSREYASQRAGCTAQRYGEHRPTTWGSFVRWGLYVRRTRSSRRSSGSMVMSIAPSRLRATVQNRAWTAVEAAWSEDPTAYSVALGLRCRSHGPALMDWSTTGSGGPR
jgi:hypothetical protein